MVSKELKDIILRLNDVGCFKFGQFRMRTGEITPCYVDMRVMWSYPDIVEDVCKVIGDVAKQHKYKHVCGLPYQGIPIATKFSLDNKIPMILKRQEAKKYGTGQLFEGHFTKGDTVLLIDDVLMTGATILKDTPEFRKVGLVVDECVVFMDRDQGGGARCVEHCQVKVHSVITLKQIYEILNEAGKLESKLMDEMLLHLSEISFSGPLQ